MKRPSTQPNWQRCTMQFAISCVIDYCNSMRPRISGEVVAGPRGGSSLRLRHQLHPLVLAFGAVWAVW